MVAVASSEAKARLSELVDMVKRGEVVSITRRGKPVARLFAEGLVRRPVDIEMLRRVPASTKWQHESAGVFFERVRGADGL